MEPLRRNGELLDPQPDIITIGHVGMVGVEVVPVRYIASPDGAVGITREELLEAARVMGAGDVLWIAPVTPQEVPSPVELANDNDEELRTEFIRGRLKINRDDFELTVDDEVASPPGKVFLVADLLTRNAGQTVTYQMFASKWGSKIKADSQTIGVNVRRLKVLLGPLGDYIVNDFGIGYRLVETLEAGN